MPTSTTQLLAMRAVGEALRTLRTDAERTQNDVAAGCKVSQENYSRWETGKRLPSQEQLALILAYFKVTDRVRGRVEGLWEAASNMASRWYDHSKFRDLFVEGMDAFAYEDASRRITTFTSTLIPACLQTRGYVEGLIQPDHRFNDPDIRPLFMEARTLRTAVLRRPRTAPFYDAMCLEWALHAKVGGEEARQEQLSHLLLLMAHENVNFRVIPATAGAAAVEGTSFTIYDFPGESTRPIISHHLPDTLTFSDKLSEVKAVRGWWGRLSEYALSPDDTRDLIEKVKKS